MIPYFIAILALCFGSVQAAISLDRSLLHFDFLKYKHLEPYEGPYTVYYQKDSKELAFVASYHGSGLEHPTFQMVKKTVDSFQPEVVIIEGFPSYVGIDFPHFLPIAETNAKNNFAHCGESVYSLFLAHQNHFSYIGGEPDDDTIIEQCLKAGYTSEDLLGFYLVRQIPQWRREGKLDPPTFENQAVRFLQSIQTKHQLAPFDMNQFYAWFLEKEGVCFDLEEIHEGTTAPAKKGAFLEKLSWKITALRDEHLQKVIQQMVTRYDRVLVVYGRAHHVIHRSALEKHFGRPQFLENQRPGSVS